MNGRSIWFFFFDAFVCSTCETIDDGSISVVHLDHPAKNDVGTGGKPHCDFARKDGLKSSQPKSKDLWQCYRRFISRP